MDKNQALQNIAKKGNVEVALLQKELTEIIAQMPPTPDREKLALRELNNRYSGPPDKTGKFDICIVGVYNLTDFNRKAIKDARELYAKNKEAALEKGLIKIIDGEPVVIDMKKTFGKDNVKNGNFGKPLGNSWNRNALVLAKADGTATWTVCDLSLRGDFAHTSLPAMYKSLKANLLGSLADGLKTAKSTKFNESAEKIDYNTVLTTLAKDKIVMLGDAFDEAKKHAKGEDGFYQRFIITSGEVRFMNDPKKEGGSYNGMIDDFTTDKMVTVFVDGSLDKPEIGQNYNFIAQSSIGFEYDTETKANTKEEKLVLNVLGFYS